MCHMSGSARTQLLACSVRMSDTCLLYTSEPMAKAAVAAGADGRMIEVHNNPECALCDGAQSLKPEKFDALLKQIRQIAEVVGKQI